VLQDREDATRQGQLALYDTRSDCGVRPLSVISVGFMPARQFHAGRQVSSGHQRRRAQSRLSNRPARQRVHH
jgi:hypothetical protein